jgi:hypothetical protein
VAFTSFGDASSETALRFGHRPLSKGESMFSWVASHALARQDALTPFSDPDAHTLPMLSVRLQSVIQREYQSLRHGSSLFALEGNFSRFNQGSIFSHISCFTHNLVMRVHEVGISCSSVEGLKGGHRFSAACPESCLGPSVCGEALLMMIINDLITNLYRRFHGVFEH